MWEINVKDRKALPFVDAEEGEWSGPFFFVQGADCQYGLISRYLEHDTKVNWEKEKALTKAIVARVNKMQPPPRFFIVCGDLVDAFQKTDDRAPQEADFKSIFGDLRPDVPLLCVCGNHDVGDCPTSITIEGYKKSFGDDYYSFLCGGILFIVINSQYFFDSSGAEEESLQHSQWLERILQSVETRSVKRAVVFQHIPWFLQSTDEPQDPYFNLKPSLRDEWLPKFQNAGVEAVFCGHYHRNAGGDYKGMPVVVTSAIGAQLGEDQSGARIVTVLKDGIKHQYYPIEELPLKNL